MTEPENALTKQYAALVDADGAKLEFTADGIAEIARIAAHGERAHGEHRRAPAAHGDDDAARGRAVRAPRPRREDGHRRSGAGAERLKAIVEDEDLRRYIL